MRHEIRATENSDADALAAEAVRRIPAGSLDDSQRGALGEQVATALGSLVEQGRRLAAQGSQMRAERRVEVGGFEVLIRFAAGARPSLWEKLRRALGGG